MTFEIYSSTYKLKKSSKSKFGAELVANTTDFGEEVRQKSFLRIHLCCLLFYPEKRLAFDKQECIYAKGAKPFKHKMYRNIVKQGYLISKIDTSE